MAGLFSLGGGGGGGGGRGSNNDDEQHHRNNPPTEIPQRAGFGTKTTRFRTRVSRYGSNRSISNNANKISTRQQLG